MNREKLHSDRDRMTLIIILICVTITAIGCVLGISYLQEYGFYKSGDNGMTARSVAVQTYSLDDMEQAKDYYFCLVENNDEYRLSYYAKRFSAEKTNFIFSVTDHSGKILFSNAVLDESAESGFRDYKSSDLGYSGTTDFFLYDEAGKMAPLQVNYYIVTNEEIQVNDKYSTAFRWISLANSLRYALFGALVLAVVALVVLLCVITVNAGQIDPETGEVIPGLMDRIPLDLWTLFIVGIFTITWIVSGLTSAADTGIVLNNVVIIIVGCVIMTVLMSFLETLSVRVKMGKIYRNTVIYRIFRIFKRKTPRKIRRAVNGKGSVAKTVISLVLFIFSEAALLCLTAYFGIARADEYSGTSVFKVFIALWAATRLILIPIVVMIAINLNYVREEGQRLAEGVLGDEIASKITISSIRAHGKNLDQIKKEINKAMEQELKSERLKSELLTNVSHDLRTPLTSITSYAELLGRKDITPEERMEYAEVLQRQSEKLSKLFDDLMDISKIASGNMKVELENLSLNIAIMQAVDEFAYRFEQSELIPRVELPADDIIAFCDGNCIWRVLTNLFSNACKYAEPGSDITVSLDSEAGKAIIKVSNISKDEISSDGDELMDRFKREDSSRHTEGHGLGLAISKDLVELQKGTMRIDVDGRIFTAVIELDAV